jgi:hypothetical protein
MKRLSRSFLHYIDSDWRPADCDSSDKRDAREERSPKKPHYKTFTFVVGNRRGEPGKEHDRKTHKAAEHR